MTITWDLSGVPTDREVKLLSKDKTQVLADMRAAAEYKLSLTANEFGVGRSEFFVRAEKPPETKAVITAPSSADEGTPVRFDGTRSTSAVTGDPTLTYTWAFGDGSTGDFATGDHTYADNGAYTVKLTVTDSQSTSDAATSPITIHNVPPTIISVIAAPAQLPSVGGSSTITVNATDASPADRPGLRYSFDCNGDGDFNDAPSGDAGNQISNSTTCTFPAANPGRRNIVGVKVTDKDGGVSTGSTNVDVGVVGVTAVIEAPATGDEGSPVTFDGSKSKPSLITNSPIVNYQWKFNDGTIINAASPGVSHTFADDGTYTVTMVSTAQDGETGDTSRTITIRNVAPTIAAVFATPIAGDEPLTSRIVVNATDPAGPSDPLTFRFDCDGDGTFDIGPQASNSANCIFTDGPASVTVNARVDDQDGGVTTGSLPVPVTVNNVPPTLLSVVASPQRLSSSGGNSTITVNATDPSTADRPGLRYSFNCNNDGDFDDTSSGDAKNQTSNFTVCKFTAADKGRNQVGVEVSDKDDGAVGVAVPVDVGPFAFIAAPTSGDEGSPVTFDARGSKPGNAVPPVPITNYRWDFGDGTEVGGPGPVVSHTFSDNSTYTVRLVITDGAEDTADATHTITIRNVKPNIISVTVTPSSGDEPLTSTITVNAADPVGPNDPLTFRFDCNGDGTFEIGPQASSSANCFFPDGPATVVVGVEVNDGDGGVSTSSVQVTVRNVAPTITSIVALPSQFPITGGASTITVNATDPAGGSDQLRYSFDCNGDGDFVDAGDTANQTGNSADCNFPGGAPPTRIVNVRVDDGDGGVTAAQATVLVGSSVELAILPAASSPEVGAQFQLRLHVTADSPVDTVHAVIKYGWRLKLDSLPTSPSNKFSTVLCSFTNPAGSGDGAITCTASGDPVTGEFDVRIFNFTAVSPGQADLRYDAPTDATLGGNSVLSRTFDAVVTVNGPSCFLPKEIVKPGWTLIGWACDAPVAPQEISTRLGGFVRLLRWDANSQSFTESYRSDRPFNSLTELTKWNGYWLFHQP